MRGLFTSIGFVLNAIVRLFFVVPELQMRASFIAATNKEIICSDLSIKFKNQDTS